MVKPDIHILIRIYSRKVYNIAYRITGNQHDAEDVTQDTFLQVHRGLEGFRGDIAAILQIDKNTVKARLNRAKTGLGDYFSGRCQWIERSGDCSCESRLGFALSAAPEILRRLKNRPPDKAIRKRVRQTVGEFMDIDRIYSSLPMEEYQTEALESCLKGA